MFLAVLEQVSSIPGPSDHNSSINQENLKRIQRKCLVCSTRAKLEQSFSSSIRGVLKRITGQRQSNICVSTSDCSPKSAARDQRKPLEFFSRRFICQTCCSRQHANGTNGRSQDRLASDETRRREKRGAKKHRVVTYSSVST